MIPPWPRNRCHEPLVLLRTVCFVWNSFFLPFSSLSPQVLQLFEIIRPLSIVHLRKRIEIPHIGLGLTVHILHPILPIVPLVPRNLAKTQTNLSFRQIVRNVTVVPRSTVLDPILRIIRPLAFLDMVTSILTTMTPQHHLRTILLLRSSPRRLLTLLTFSLLMAYMTLPTFWMSHQKFLDNFLAWRIPSTPFPRTSLRRLVKYSLPTCIN